MRLCRLRLAGFRNLEDIELAFPPEGVTLLGDNGQGKTNLLEAVYYPVFYRSVHAARDSELVRFSEPGFWLDAELSPEPEVRRRLSTRFLLSGRVKQVERDGERIERIGDEIGQWLAVAFLPRDLTLAAGGAQERRRYLDRMLAVADRGYYLALLRYRAALNQRNAALRSGRDTMAQAFDRPLGAAGAVIVAARLRWVSEIATRLREEMARLGEAAVVSVSYRGDPDLADQAGWERALASVAGRDRARATTTVGPHRDDLQIRLDERPVREFGSTGQQRSVAIALKFLELATLEAARGVVPALLLDDVFAELDQERQRRLAERLAGAGERQVFLTSPRADELPANLALPVWRVEGGRIEAGRRVGG